MLLTKTRRFWPRKLAQVALALATCIALPSPHANASYKADWYLAMYADGHFLCRIGAQASASDTNSPGPSGLPPTAYSGVAAALYRENGSNWTGTTGFYPKILMAPIPPGGVKTWGGLYLWTQNYTPATPGTVQVLFGEEPDFTATGYTAHLVLDYVPDSANWGGPPDFWLDLGVGNTISLPATNTTNPLLDGTRMHLDIYAPVPEPSSLAALVCGLAGMGGFALETPAALHIGSVRPAVLGKGFLETTNGEKLRVKPGERFRISDFVYVVGAVRLRRSG